MKIFINTTNWAIQKIENEYPVLVGDNYVDAIKVYYDANPSTAHIYPTLTIQKPNGRKIGPFVYDPEVYGEDEEETTTYPITYEDADSNTWYMYAFTLSSDNGQLTSTGKYQVTVTTNKTNALGTAIVGQRNTNVQLEVLHAVTNNNQDILILGESPDEVIASFQQLITNLTTNVATLDSSKADRDNINQEIVAKELEVKEINSVDAYTALKLIKQTGCSIIVDNSILIKDNLNVPIAEFKRSSSESRMDLGSDFQLKARSGDCLVLSNEIPLRLIYSGEDDNTEIKLSDGKIELLAPNNIKVTVDDAGYINLTTPKAELEVSGPDNRVNMHIEDTENDAIYGDMVLDPDGFEVLTTDGDNTKRVFIQPNSAAIDNKEIVTEDVLDAEANNLQSQIDGLNAGQNLADIVANLTTLNNLPITNLKDGDKVQVLVDSHHDNASTVYKLVISGSSHSWSYIGKYGQDGYTKSEANALLATKQNVIDSTHKISSDLVDDTNATNKFVLQTDMDYWNLKQEPLVETTSTALSGGGVVVKDSYIEDTFFATDEEVASMIEEVLNNAR